MKKHLRSFSYIVTALLFLPFWHAGVLTPSNDLPPVNTISQSKAPILNDQLFDSYSETEFKIWAADAPKYVINVSDRGLALDNLNHPHIAYGGDDLFYANFDGTTWDIQAVDAPQNGFAGSSASIALDSSGNPHIGYFGEGKAKYAVWNGNSWDITAIANADYNRSNETVIMALDSNDSPHFAFSDLSGGGVQYATKNGADWNIEQIDGWGENLSLALSESGEPHLAYYKYDDAAFDYNLIYAEHTASGWISETLATISEDWEKDVSIRLDSLGQPHIAYFRSPALVELVYAYKSGAVWNSQVVQSLVDGGDVSLELDQSDSPHLVYWYYEKARYAYYTTQWELEDIGNEEGGYDVSLALESSGSQHVFHTSFFGDVRYAFRQSSGWNDTLIDEFANLGRNSSIAMKGYSPYISYTDGSNLYIKLSFWHQGMNEWRNVSLFNTDYSSPSSIAIDSLGEANILFKRDYPEGVMYAVFAGGASALWNTSGNKTTSNRSIAVENTEEFPPNPHILYNDLTYAHWVTPTWESQLIDPSGSKGTIALDTQNIPHICYSKSVNDDIDSIEYSTLNGDTWDKETIDPNGDRCMIAIGGDAVPQVVYTKPDSASTNLNLIFGIKGPSGWITQTIDTNVSPRFGLAIDPENKPHVAYAKRSGVTNTLLYYATSLGAAWDIQPVDANYSYYDYPAIAVDARGAPHISFADMRRMDLMHATIQATAQFSTSVSSGPAPLEVQFTNHSIGAYEEIAWNFGDGSSSTQENPVYSYSLPGTYTATLTISGLGGESTASTQIDIPGAATTVTPGTAGSLVFEDPLGFTSTINFPAGAVITETLFVYSPLLSPPSTNGYSFLGIAFTINAYQNGIQVDGLDFEEPVTVRLDYQDSLVVGVNENEIALYYWDGDLWEDAACGDYERHPDDNWLAVPICHLSDFAWMIKGDYKIFLPNVMQTIP